MSDLSTPLMKQYLEIKKDYPHEILFFRMGDFYEMFGEDAKVASQILGIALTSRSHGKSDRVPLAGVPYHSAERYLAKLIQAGKKVVICEQTEEASPAKKLVKREVVEIITPGTVTLDQVIENQKNHYLAALIEDEKEMGLAVVDLATGEFKIDQREKYKILEELEVLNPAEILIPDSWYEEKVKYLKAFADTSHFTKFESWKYDYDSAHKNLTEQLQVASLDGFGCQNLKLGVVAAGAVLSYLKGTKKTLLAHLNKISVLQNNEEMFLDANTIRNLELFPSTDNNQSISLFSILNQTKTAMGGRLLKSWLAKPLLNREKILERQSAVAELVLNSDAKSDLKEKLSFISDLERLAGKIGYGKATPKDLLGVKESLKIVPAIQKQLTILKSPLLKNIKDNFLKADDLVNLMENSIADDPPLVLNEGGIIKKGFDAELDKLSEMVSKNKEWILNLQKEEREKSGISSLKVGYNQVFGYYIEVTTPHLSKVPANYIRKQTLTNAERFITPELKEREDLILNAQEKINQKEYELFLQIRSQVAERTKDIQKTAELLSAIDVLTALSTVATDFGYTRPEVDQSSDVLIEEGRHPVLERVLDSGSFIPNETRLSDSELIHIITGPNMAGKSTYLRQVGLIALLAQIGSFVPAKKAKIGIVDRIFTRVGAMDNITLGQSTFLVEMNETANILNYATAKSLILLDEIGRGTSTFDGLSIAWAVTEHIHNQIKAKTLFATHYHELTELATFLPQVKNYNVAVKESKGEVIFLRKIVPGGCDDSYGIEVAKLAGIPKEVLERAKDILTQLEEGEVTVKKIPMTKVERLNLSQKTLFEEQSSEIEKELKGLEVEKMTAIEALNKLAEWKRKLAD